MQLRKLKERPDLPWISESFGTGYIKNLDPRNEWWGVYADGEIIAVAAMEPQGKKTAELTAAVVRSDFRGLGLQRKLIKARLKAAEDAGITRVRTYTDPDNEQSIINLMKSGFKLSKITPHRLYFTRSLP